MILLIHPRSDHVGMPGLAEALREAGANVEQHFMTGDYSTLLDALVADVVPIVVKV